MEGHKELIAQAEQATGLSQWGGDTFREGLERLVNALNTEARLNAAGEHVLRDRIMTHLRQRLQIEEWYRRHPEIDEVELIQPLFGISLPRTGSTALSFLLSEDPEIRYLRMWESYEPCPPPSTVSGPDPRRESALAMMQSREADSSHTPSALDGPFECQDLMALDFRSQMFQAFATIPSYSDWMFDSDMTSCYQYERRALKLLQWGEKPRPWRLKCPTHLAYLDYLDKAFPDARFVMTHRDPTQVMLSVASVYADIARNFTDDLDYVYMGELNRQQWSKAMERAIAFRENGNEHRFHDIHFRAMREDPIGEVTKLYSFLGEPVSEVFEANMRRWWKENSETREPRSNLDPALFGLDLEGVRADFAAYNERVPRWTGRPAA